METRIDPEARPDDFPPEPLTAARHELDDAFRKFKKRASAANYRALEQTALAYQNAQYEAELARTEREYQKRIR